MAYVNMPTNYSGTCYMQTFPSVSFGQVHQEHKGLGISKSITRKVFKVDGKAYVFITLFGLEQMKDLTVMANFHLADCQKRAHEAYLESVPKEISLWEWFGMKAFHSMELQPGQTKLLRVQVDHPVPQNKENCYQLFKVKEHSEELKNLKLSFKESIFTVIGYR